MNDSVNLILQSSLGRELTADEARFLGELMNERALTDGQFLITEGTADDSLHVILAGKLEVVKRSGANEFVNLGILRDGDLAGELSFIDGQEHSVGLRALCDSKVLTLKRADFEGIIEKNPQLVYKVMRAITRSAARIVHRMNQEFSELSNYIFKQHGRY